MTRSSPTRTPRRRLFLCLVLQAALIVSPLVAQEPPAVPPVAQDVPATQAAAPVAAVAPETPHAVSNRDRNRAAKAYAKGAKAMDADDPRQATAEFQHAVELDPANHDYQNAAEIARQHLLTQLVQESAKAKLTGQDDVARARLEEALKIDPKNAIVTQHIAELADATAPRNPSSPYAPIDFGSIEITPKNVRQSFHIRANTGELLRQVFAAYGITALMDESVRAQSVRMDADDLDFAKAAELVSLITRTFWVPLDPRRALIAVDTKENRQKFQRQFVETVYLPGMTPADMSDVGNVVRNIFDAQQSVVQQQNGTLTIRAPEATLKAVNATLAGLVEGRGQVLLDMRIYEIAHTRTTNIGIQLPQQATIFNIPTEINNILAQNASLVNQIISSGLAQAGDYAAIAAILIASGAVSGTILSQPFAVFGGGITQEGLTFGAATANFSLNTSDSRMLDQVQLRAGDQEAATLRSGTRYPIVTSIYSTSTIGTNVPGLTSPGLSSTLQSLGINASTLGQASVTPQVQYEDLGLTLKATPHIQRSHEVTLQLDMKVEALGGTTLNGNPILNNRQFTGTITIPDGNTAVLVTNMNRQESRAVSGIPGISEVPGFQSTTNVGKQIDVSNLMVLITPHVVRRRGSQTVDPMVMIPIH
jgi:general secretion pathway protein D